MPSPTGQTSDSHILQDLSVQGQGSTNPSAETGFFVCDRALGLLGATREFQTDLSRPAALAWERAAFSEAFDHPEPGERIRRFLEKA